MRHLKLLVVAVVYAIVAVCRASAADISAAPEPQKLAVLLNYGAGVPAITAEDLVQILANPTQSSEAPQLAAEFQNPLRASLLLTKRLPASYRATLPNGDPDELLHRYIVLEYPDSATTFAAKAALQKDPMVLYVQESTFYQFSVAPADPLFATQSKVQNYQWGTNNPLNLQSAWNSVRGTAFLAHLDNGIQNNSPTTLHEDLGQPWRPQFNFNVAGGIDVDEHPELTNAGQYGYHVAGHGTHTAGIMAAATSQSSVPAGYPNPTPALGGAGVCWYCNLMIAKVSRINSNGIITIDATIDVPNAINWAATSGAQVMNMSFGGPDPNCTQNPYNAFCLALNSASAKEVVLVAATGDSDINVGGSGNQLGTKLDFPAVSSYTIAAGAIQSYSGTRGNLWTEESPQQGFRGSSTGPGMDTRGILAPGRDVLATFYYSQDWNKNIRCGTDPTFPFGQLGTSKGPKYGICTGTSMAAPYITGIVGLLRTVNPLLGATTIRTTLLSSGDNAGSPNTTRGFGVPNAATAVNSVLATTNRLTPLFSLYSSVAWDHFYTVVPQQARASIAYGLLPYAVAPTSYAPYYGTTIAEYTQFAQGYLINYVDPTAEVWVFSTHVNPFNSSVELMPLYRLSWKCGDPGTSVCSSNPKHVSHFYTSSLSEAHTYIGSAYYKFDGIEGYICPLSASQPAGTTMLMRAYNSSRDDYATFPQQQQANFASQGYTSYVTNLGYVFLNNGSRPSY